MKTARLEVSQPEGLSIAKQHTEQPLSTQSYDASLCGMQLVLRQRCGLLEEVAEGLSALGLRTSFAALAHIKLAVV